MKKSFSKTAFVTVFGISVITSLALADWRYEGNKRCSAKIECPSGKKLYCEANGTFNKCEEITNTYPNSVKCEGWRGSEHSTTSDICS